MSSTSYSRSSAATMRPIRSLPPTRRASVRSITENSVIFLIFVNNIIIKNSIQLEAPAPKAHHDATCIHSPFGPCRWAVLVHDERREADVQPRRGVAQDRSVRNPRVLCAEGEARANELHRVCAVKHKRKRTTTVYYFIARWTHLDARFSFRALLFPRPPIVSLHFFPSHIHTT